MYSSRNSKIMSELHASFLDLPGELRNDVYQLCLEEWFAAEEVSEVLHLLANLKRVSQSIYFEASSLYWAKRLPLLDTRWQINLNNAGPDIRTQLCSIPQEIKDTNMVYLIEGYDSDAPFPQERFFVANAIPGKGDLVTRTACIIYSRLSFDI